MPCLTCVEPLPCIAFPCTAPVSPVAVPRQEEIRAKAPAEAAEGAEPRGQTIAKWLLTRACENGTVTHTTKLPPPHRPTHPRAHEHGSAQPRLPNRALQREISRPAHAGHPNQVLDAGHREPASGGHRCVGALGQSQAWVGGVAAGGPTAHTHAQPTHLHMRQQGRGCTHASTRGLHTRVTRRWQ